MPAAGKTLGEEKRIRTTAASLKRALKGVKGPVALEAVGFYRPIARWLIEQGHDVRLANPRLIPKAKVKTDKKDAKHLAKLLRADLLPESWIPPEETQQLRDLVRHRRFLGEEAGRLKSKIKHDLLKHGHFFDKNPVETINGRAQARKLGIPEITSSINILETLENETKQADAKIKLEANKRPEAKILMTTPGVAEFTALGILEATSNDSQTPRNSPATQA